MRPYVHELDIGGGKCVVSEWFLVTPWFVQETNNLQTFPGQGVNETSQVTGHHYATFLRPGRHVVMKTEPESPSRLLNY
jgi:hypothetical protein